MIFRTHLIPFDAFAPCAVQGCQNYADFAMTSDSPSIKLPDRDFCSTHTHEVRLAARVGPDQDGRFRAPDGRVLWDANGWTA